MHKALKQATIKQSNDGPIIFICMDLHTKLNFKTGKFINVSDFRHHIRHCRGFDKGLI